VGPGSVTLAHTADEHVEIADLERSVDIYAQLAASLISQSA
jgi:acetylornithine deacetylase/succinyl-diaminopimelate desuccinylase-like protein